MSRVAALTMVRNDDFFLEKWVEYYGRELGKENLFVFFDGTDQQIPEFCAGTNAEAVEKIGSHVVSAEKGRLRFLSEKAKTLLEAGYEAVIGVDADEYIVADPKLKVSLISYITSHNNGKTLSALGLDFGQKLGKEGDLTLASPFLEQRKYARIGTRYTKPSVLFRPSHWGSGFHRIKGENFQIGKDLYLMHFGYSDIKTIEDRFKDADRISQGWERHIRKRSRTIRYVTSLKARNFDRMTRICRVIQSMVRPPYAWNKPAMFGSKIIVEIPSRFREIL